MTPWEIAGKSESSQQKALFAWAAMAQRHGFAAAWDEIYYKTPHFYDAEAVPELAWLFAIPNGSNRDAVTAGRLKAEGVKKGVWDIFWPLKRKSWSGLWVEMKVGTNGQTPEQKQFEEFTGANGFLNLVCYIWEDAAKVVQHYFQVG